MAQPARSASFELIEVPGRSRPAGVQVIIDRGDTDEDERDMWRAFAEHMQQRREARAQPAASAAVPPLSPLRLL